MARDFGLLIPRQQDAVRAADLRVKDFEEIATGFDYNTAMIEAERCVQCANPPCSTEGCPLGNAIPRWIDHVAHGRIKEAARVLHNTSNLPEMCGKLCPQEILCESRCVVGDGGKTGRPVAIGKLEAWVSKTAREKGWIFGLPAEASGKKVAVIGSGPAGFASAEQLVAKGHKVIIFEKQPVLGGVPVYGIPTFKYGKDRIPQNFKRLESRGVEFKTNTAIGADIPLNDLFDKEGFDAVVMAVGALKGRDVKVDGRKLSGVSLATEFLVNSNLPSEQLRDDEKLELKAGKSCVVFGGGDTATDCLRSAIRMGFEKVTCIYRRSEKEMPGRVEDRKYAEDEGVDFHFLAAPLRFEGEGSVAKVVCQQMELGEPDESGRRRPLPVEGQTFEVEADHVVLALGYELDDKFLSESGAELENGRWLKLNDDVATSRPGLFAAGDLVNGADLIVTAVRSARKTAEAVDEYLKNI